MSTEQAFDVQQWVKDNSTPDAEERHRFWMFHWHAEHPSAIFDVAFYHRKALLDVSFNASWAREFCSALMCRAGVKRLTNILARVTFSDGTVSAYNNIWMLVPMPRELDTSKVDMRDGDQIIGLNGESIRTMVSAVYHCESQQEEDHFLRRWLAS